MTSSPPLRDPWDLYGRSREGDDRVRGVGGRLYWDWYQRIGPGAEVLGRVEGRVVADLGAGGGRQAAHVAGVLGARRVVAVDASEGQIARAREGYGHVRGLEFVHGDAVAALRDAPGSLDVAYSCFGAADFTDPRALLPAVRTALRPGGLLVVATLGHYRGGRAAEDDVRPGAIRVRYADGTTGELQRWVLDPAVWEKLLLAAGFVDVAADVLRDAGDAERPAMATALLRAVAGEPFRG